MTSLDIHPEELLDKANAGTLGPEERVHLDRHLAVCAVCRFEVRVRADFESIQAGPEDSDALVRKVLEGDGIHAARRPRTSRSWRGGVAAALLLGGIGYAAVANKTVLIGAWRELIGNNPIESREPSASREPVERVVPTETVREEVKVLPELAHESIAGVAPIPVVSAEVLLKQATVLRRESKPLLAAQAYQGLIGRYPASPEAAVAHAALGRMYYDSRDPDGALKHFDAYLASGEKDLEEEVLVLKALALQRTGATGEELLSLQALLERYPQSLHAPAARARLSELSK